MEFDQEQLNELGHQCERVEVLADGPHHFILLTNLELISDGKVVVMDALLCPFAHTGYATRLFLAEPLSHKQKNWTIHQLLGRNWHTWSWKGVEANQRLSQILASHLTALI
ncbi:MAG: hypothetical protein H6779_02365 [Candidatus Nomurabacteria bacterium]|nr:MAG: hypothetical protein H6779_02365 [Candidatus Nomurabacteria bacterium]